MLINFNNGVPNEEELIERQFTKSIQDSNAVDSF